MACTGCRTEAARRDPARGGVCSRGRRSPWLPQWVAQRARWRYRGVSDARQSEAPAESPERALRAIGVRCTVEARGRLAIVMAAPGERALEDAAVRRAVL